ncbi:MAG TPA: hypothetical protein VHK01_20530 [Lacipirellulaceae bacterium]|nr:hypothetical protein [Lacipirellulaceae bacterium]
MKRPLLILFTLLALLMGMSAQSADAQRVIRGHGGARLSASGHRKGFGHGKGFHHGRRFGKGFGAGVFIDDDDDSDYADLYRELLNNVPYFALHPPVYYSYPVPRTYGYSPFAYGPWVMTPEAAPEVKPLTIINPYVPNAEKAPVSEASDRSAAVSPQPQPLVIINPYVAPSRAVAVSQQ